jgi:hypothetical protein
VAGSRWHVTRSPLATATVRSALPWTTTVGVSNPEDRIARHTSLASDTETEWESADKPDSVSTVDQRWGDHLSRADVSVDLQRPTRCSAGHLDAPAWPCSGRGSPGRRRHRRRRCALTAPFHPYPRGRGARAGGLLSVALCRVSPRLGVTQRPALWSPDFPQRTCARRGRLADSHRPRIPVPHVSRPMSGAPLTAHPAAPAPDIGAATQTGSPGPTGPGVGTAQPTTALRSSTRRWYAATSTASGAMASLTASAISEWYWRRTHCP